MNEQHAGAAFRRAGGALYAANRDGNNCVLMI